MLEKIEKELKKYNKTSSKRFIIAIEWFDNTYAKMNSDECHLFITGNKFEDLWVKIGKNRIWENRTVKHLGITIYNELSVCVCVCLCVCMCVCVCVYSSTVKAYSVCKMSETYLRSTDQRSCVVNRRKHHLQR